jgi:hypothetical protein
LEPDHDENYVTDLSQVLLSAVIVYYFCF